MFFKKIPNINFVIISENPNFGRFKYTKNSIINNYGDNTSITCVFSKNSKEDLKLYKNEVETHIVKNNNTLDLINVGIKKSKEDWNLIVNEGTWIKPNMDKKYSSFIKNEFDILYPIFYELDINGKMFNVKTDFIDCSLNGMMINKKCFDKIGIFEQFDFLESKTLWFFNAIEKKCSFKAILGNKLF
mgnify:CR=1 FL=1